MLVKYPLSPKRLVRLYSTGDIDDKDSTWTEKQHDSTKKYSKALALADFYRVLSTQNIERIWPLYTYLYDNNLLHILTSQNYYQLFTYTVRATPTLTNYYRLLALVDDMKELSIPLRLTDYNALISWTGGRPLKTVKSHHLNEALTVFEEMQKAEITNAKGEVIRKQAIQPSVDTFNALIGIASRIPDLRTAQKLYHDMLARGLIPDKYTYSILFNLVGNVGDIGGIDDIKRDMLQNLSRDDLRNVKLWNSLLTAYARNGQRDKVHEVLEHMKAPNNRPSRNKPLGVRKTKKWERGIPSPDADSYRIYIQMMIDYGEPKESIFDKFLEMRRRCISPIIQLYNVMFRSFMKPVEHFPDVDTLQRRPNELELLKKLYALLLKDLTKIEPNSDTLYTLVSAFLDLEDTKTALEAFVFLSNHNTRNIPTTEKSIQHNAVALLAKERHKAPNQTKIEPPKELLDRLRAIVAENSTL